MTDFQVLYHSLYIWKHNNGRKYREIASQLGMKDLWWASMNKLTEIRKNVTKNIIMAAILNNGFSISFLSNPTP